MPNRTRNTTLLEKVELWIEDFLQKRRLSKLPMREKAHRPVDETSVNLDLALEVGNELLITDEIVEMYKDLSNAVGRVVIIDQISMKEKEIIKASAFGIQVNVNMSVAQEMRAAFLQRDRLWSS